MFKIGENKTIFGGENSYISSVLRTFCVFPHFSEIWQLFAGFLHNLQNIGIPGLHWSGAQVIIGELHTSLSGVIDNVQVVDVFLGPQVQSGPIISKLIGFRSLCFPDGVSTGSQINA